MAADPTLRVPDDATGPSAAGVDEATQWLRSALGDAAASPHLLFLIGGPGGGKSQAASRLVHDLDEVDPGDPALAHRKYSYTAAGRRLDLVNDATISTDGDSIIRDVSDAMTSGKHLLACVNRGILADALASTSEQVDGSDPALDLVRWLAEPASQSEWLSAFTNHGGFLRMCELRTPGGTTALISAVYIDACSLLEARPEVHLGSHRSAAYHIWPFAKAERQNTPAGALLSLVAERLEWDAELPEDLDPIRANLTALRSKTVLSGHLQLLRAAEIATSERMTYREVWGATCRMLFADLPMRMPADQAVDFLQKAAPLDVDQPHKAFAPMKELASLRSFVGMFGGLEPTNLASGQDPVLRFLSPIDPLWDVRPGHLGKQGSGWASPVLDAFGSTALGGSPLDSLESEMPAEARDIIQPFDRSLDAAFTEYTRAATPAERQRATSWYGAYLSRLYATAMGVPAFNEVVKAWTDAWTSSPGLPDDLRGPLRTLLNPRRHPGDPDSNPVVPVYASRTEPILGYVTEPTLALRASTFQFDTDRDGEALHLDVQEEGQYIGSVLLDFDLLREALTCADDWLGLTEARGRTEPRVERFRSRRLVSENLASAPKLAVEYRMLDHQVTLEASQL